MSLDLTIAFCDIHCASLFPPSLFVLFPASISLPLGSPPSSSTPDMLHNNASTVAPADAQNSGHRYCRKCRQVLAITERFKACERCRAKERAYARARRDAHSASAQSKLSRASTSRPQGALDNHSSSATSAWTSLSRSLGFSFTPSPADSSSTAGASHFASPSSPVPHTAPATTLRPRSLDAHTQATRYTFAASAASFSTSAPVGASPDAPPAYAAAPAARPSGTFLERLLADIALATGWLATLQSLGMTEANLRVMADWEEGRRDALIAKVVPAMSIMDRALLGEAISRL
ncbi:hypothetical protein DFH07DRAFT_765608 [Mycena maculata]|uniref:Uncharacterized protein n=1 Tax=Mycena maculata TaxID=230809 RepID=A0AAD7K6P3_9AGAR|nr:hypothetical protein DFH07DRAFT_765608 [Mycena maculata]